jgi:trehalose/maltose hydrolase-like predicted phosphorylase
VEIREGVLYLHPQLPGPLVKVRLRVRYRGQWIALSVTRDTLIVTVEKGGVEKAVISFRGELHELDPGEVRSFNLS